MPSKGRKAKKRASKKGDSNKKWPNNEAPPNPTISTTATYGKILPFAPPLPVVRPKKKEVVKLHGKAPAQITQPLGAPIRSPTKVPQVKLLVQGPVSNEYPAGFCDPLLVDLIGLVSQRCHVQVEYEAPVPRSLVLHGTLISSVRMAHGEICGLIQEAGNSHSTQVIFWIQTANSDSEMPCIKSALPTQLHHSDPGHANGWQLGTVGLSSAHSQITEFCAHFSRVADNIKTNPRRLHMNFELGTILVDVTGNNDVDTSQGIRGLETFLERASAKGGTMFDYRIGDRDMFYALQKMVIDADGSFDPCSSAMTYLHDTQPRNYLIICTEAFLIEFVVPNYDTARNSSTKLSQMRVFQRRMADCNIDMEAVCLNQRLDWRMCFLQELNLEDVPPSIRDIGNYISVNYVVEDDDFPVPTVRHESILPSRIKRITGKKTWTVGCKGTRYLLELSLCREWSLPRETQTHVWATGISLHCDSWDEALDQKHGSLESRDFGQNFSAMFAPAGTRDGIKDFFSAIEGISALSEMVIPVVDTNDNELSEMVPFDMADHRTIRAKDFVRKFTMEDVPTEIVLESITKNDTQSDTKMTGGIDARDVDQRFVQLVDDLIVFD